MLFFKVLSPCTYQFHTFVVKNKIWFEFERRKLSPKVSPHSRPSVARDCRKSDTPGAKNPNDSRLFFNLTTSRPIVNIVELHSSPFMLWNFSLHTLAKIVTQIKASSMVYCRPIVYAIEIRNLSVFTLELRKFWTTQLIVKFKAFINKLFVFHVHS